MIIHVTHWFLKKLAMEKVTLITVFKASMSFGYLPGGFLILNI